MSQYSESYKPDLFALIKFYLFFGICWTLIIFAFLVGEFFQFRADAFHDAEVAAIATFSKDKLYRTWATNHGGVYVPVTEQTSPNPYLAHIPERDITTPSGKKLTLVNPAYMTRQVHELGNEDYGLKGKLTSLNPINQINKPDEWQAKGLKEFEMGVPEVISRENIDGVLHLRFMRPFITEKECLKCHASQGYKEGDIRGGISVSVPMSDYLAQSGIRSVTSSMIYGVIWIIGVAGLYMLYRMRKKFFIQKQIFRKALEDRNKDLKSIVYTASHDLKNPLVNIAGFNDVLVESNNQLREILAGIELDDNLKHRLSSLTEKEIPRAMEFISASAKKMRDLFDGLLQVSRFGMTKITVEHLDVRSILDDVCKTVQYTADEKNVDIEIDDLPDCFGDKDMIFELFSNLLTNAIKYLGPDREGLIKVSGKIEGGNSVYCVQDNGVGIEPRDQSKIFEIFHRLDPHGNAKGHGVGLSIVTRIVDRHNGSIHLVSEKGKGSEFYVSLPRVSFDSEI